MPRRRYKKEDRDWQAMAAKALEQAKKLAPGKERIDAMRKASQLRVAAEMMGWLSSRELRPPK